MQIYVKELTDSEPSSLSDCCHLCSMLEPRPQRPTSNGAESELGALLPVPLRYSACLRLGDDIKVRTPGCSVNHRVHLLGLSVAVAGQEVRSHLSP